MLRRFALAGLAIAILSLPQPATSQTVPGAPNTLNAPIASAFVNYVVGVIRGTKPDGHLLQRECGVGSEQSGDRVLMNDIDVVAAPGINTKALQGFPFACQLKVHTFDGQSINIASNATFRDYWGAIFDPKRTAPAEWTMDDGTVLHVPMMQSQATVVSEAHVGNLTIAGIGFRDTDFAFFLVTGDHVTLDAARGYFASLSFKQKNGFRSVLAALNIPRITMHDDTTSCPGACSNITVRGHIELALNETGLGDAPLLPKQIPLHPQSLSPIYAPCCAPPVHAAAVSANRTFYFAIVDVQTQRSLFEALVRRPTLR
jgi:hypothetical protein